jgi:hypothetical protein
LSIEASVGPVEVVVVLPFVEFLVEDFGVVDDDSVEHSVELFGVDSVGSFDFAVESRGGWFDVDVLHASVEDVPVELGSELGAVVGLDDIDSEWEFLAHVVEKLDCGFLVVAFIDFEYA